MKSLSINYETLIQLVEGKLSEEATKEIQFLLLSDEKSYWQFLQLRALHREGMLQDYLKNEEQEIDFEEEDFLSEREISDFIQNKLSPAEHQKMEIIISENPEEKYEFIKFKGLYEENELENYLIYQKEMTKKIVAEVMQQEEFKYLVEDTKSKFRTLHLRKYTAWAASFLVLLVCSLLLYHFISSETKDKPLISEKKLEKLKEFYTLGKSKPQTMKVKKKLLLHTQDAVEIVIENLSVVAKMTKNEKQQRSKLHFETIKEYFEANGKTNIQLILKETNQNLEFSDINTFLEWLENQDKADEIRLKNYTSQAKQKNKMAYIKNGKIEGKIPSSFSASSPFEIVMDSLVLELNVNQTQN